MGIARRSFLISAAAAVATPAVLRQARADAPQVTLKLHHYFSAVSGSHERFLAPWARKVEAACGGRIRIDLFPSMQLGGPPAQLFDQVRDGTVDIAWVATAPTPGRFVGIETFELPFVLSRRALVNSLALEDFAAAHLRDEFREVHPICFSCRDHGVIHAARVIRALGDLKGLRLHVPNRLAAETVRVLGGTGISVPTPQIPMALAGHVIDACLDPWDVVPGLRLNDTLKNHTDFTDSTLSAATFVLAMNKTAYERLPRDVKTAIDDNSGPPAARLAGAMWDGEARAVIETARDRGEAITIVGADEEAHWRSATEPVAAAWLKQMKERKLDGAKLIAAVRTLLASHAGEPEPQPVQAARQVKPAPTQEGSQTAAAKTTASPSGGSPDAAEGAVKVAPAPAPTASGAVPAAPAAKTPPAPPTKEFDIPL